MPVWTNTVTITVEERFDIASATISADKTRVTVGETVRFYGTARFTRPAPSRGGVYADIYVNGSRVRSGVLVGSYSTGAVSANIGFSLRFDRPGRYSVRAYVYTAPTGLRSAPSPGGGLRALSPGAWTNTVTLAVTPGVPGGGGYPGPSHDIYAAILFGILLGMLAYGWLKKGV